ncbi:MAG: hypothetical protein Q4D09_07755, partial [Clostridia bacterium]|nr:hypothetical protein [Clostridia bacterium]
MKREGDEKGTAEQSEAKNHPVNGFLVPRAGGGTAPVPPDESPYLHQIKKSMRSMGFFVCMKREGDEKRTAEQSEAKNHPVNGFLVP